MLKTKVIFRFMLMVAYLWGVVGLAQVERLEVTQTMPLDNEKRFGLAGAYEMVLGIAHFVIDPQDPINDAIVDLDQVTPDADGKIRYQADFYIIAPVDRDRGNGCLFLDIPNRGNPIGTFVNFAEALFRGPDFQPPMSGDGFLMRHGFTLAGIGWQQDIPSREGGPSFGLRGPKTKQKVEGLARAESIFSDDTPTMDLGHWLHRPYPVANPKDPRNVLTVRDKVMGKRQVIPTDQWRFGRWEKDAIVEDPGKIAMVKGVFQKGRIYELVYAARTPWVNGLGFSAVRDFAAYMHRHPDSPVEVNRVIATGASQTGRFLRHYLYAGMNLDKQGNRVLDGILATVSGAGRGSFNHRFGQPSRASLPPDLNFYPTDMFPFTGAAQKDPLSGRQEGLFANISGTKAMPKVFLFNSGHEYWGRGASLIHTSPDGSADVTLLPDVRIYHTVSVQHGPARMPPPRQYLDRPNQRIAALYPLNPANYLWAERALILALDRWIDEGTEPPPSRFPNIADGTLVTPQEYDFPGIPGVNAPPPVYAPQHIDYGPRFITEGIMDLVPPKVGEAYGVRVPKADGDGNDLGGLRLPEIVVPLATHTSWNLRDPETGAAGSLSPLTGAIFPFSRTEEERQTTGDPRPSIEARYGSREAYIGKFTEAARGLINQGYLLDEDLPDMVDFAGVLWDYIHQHGPPAVQVGQEENP